jgi:hypothetical protein
MALNKPLATKNTKFTKEQFLAPRRKGTEKEISPVRFPRPLAGEGEGEGEFFSGPSS